MLPGSLDRARRAVDAQGAGGPVAKRVQGKAAGKAKEIEHFPTPAVGCGRLPIEALVEVEAGFLHREQINMVRQTVLGDGNRTLRN